MMKLFTRLIFLVTVISLTQSCKKGCTDPTAANYNPDAKKDNGSCYYVNLPTNLIVELTTTPNSGLVEVDASALNENYFTVCFFDGNDSTIVTTTTGEASYNYSDSGSHNIRVRAHLDHQNYTEWNGVAEININSSGISNVGYTTPLSYPNYSLVWQDEFNGSSLSSDWIYEIGTGSWGWGNNELQYYRQDNASVENGYLIITAKQQNFGGSNYTSSRLKTQGRQFFTYGRIDIRAKLPYGKGIWPALWMLGETFSSVGLPSCGEIDIMEMIGGNGYNDRTVHGTVHWNENGHAMYGGSNSLPSGRFHDEFHVFSIIWDQNYIRWLRDDIQYHTINISGSNLSAFQENFFFIFNVAVGGNWPGSPDNTTVFPQRMVVDYVRVFQ